MFHKKLAWMEVSVIKYLFIYEFTSELNYSWLNIKRY